MADDRATTAEPPHRDRVASIVTLPNALSLVRLVGAPVLVWLAIAGSPVVVWVTVGLLATDWVDGKLAIWLGQCTPLGAILDSIADAALFAAIIFAVGWSRGSDLWIEGWWLSAALVSYVCSCLVAWSRFGRLPSYHAWSAKCAWWLASLAAVAAIGGWSMWPLRAAAVAVVIANAEGIAIGLVLPGWRTDVRSLWSAIEISRTATDVDE